MTPTKPGETVAERCLAPLPTYTARIGDYAVTGWPPVEMVIELCWLMDRPKDVWKNWKPKQKGGR